MKQRGRSGPFGNWQVFVTKKERRDSHRERAKGGSELSALRSGVDRIRTKVRMAGTEM